MRGANEDKAGGKHVPSQAKLPVNAGASSQDFLFSLR
jgi:hypothetical protein